MSSDFNAVMEQVDVSHSNMQSACDQRLEAEAQLKQMANDAKSTSEPSGNRWPQLDDAAFHGVAGDFVKVIEPHSEADPVAILIQFHAAFGNVVGRTAYFRAEADRHYANINVAVVGETAKGRKGTAWGHVRRGFDEIDHEWTTAHIASGLSSGEGLIWAVRDAIEKYDPGGTNGQRIKDGDYVIVDPGVDDKRLMVLETEFASTMQVLGRSGSTLSPLIRQAWDTGDLRSLTKNSPAKATGAHISIVSHITRYELLRLLNTTEAANGFCNRFLWLCVRRSKSLPEGGNIQSVDFDPLVTRIQKAASHAGTVQEVVRDDNARAMWCEVYPALSDGKPGLLGAVISRAEAQVMRLAMIYALEDMSYVVQPVHLEAALALWQYCEDSARYIFGEKLGDPDSDLLLGALRRDPNGLTRTEIRDLFQKNRKAHEIERVLHVLLDQGVVKQQNEPTDGRPIERWLAL